MNFTGATFAFATHVYTSTHIGRLHQQVCRGHKSLFYRKYSVEKKQRRLVNNVKRENVRESRILNSGEFSNLANVNIAWQRLFEAFCFVAS